ncbi:MAG: ABC transporter permease [Blautia sp.]|nr:ABC transporter permease [Blautia sp.]
MLFRKMLREIRSDLGMCISVIILSFLAVFTYCGFNGDVIGFRKELAAFKEQTNFSDGWIYSEGFSADELTAVRSLDFVKDAQLRTELKGTAPDFNGAQINIYLEDESLVTVPLVVEGEAFDPQDTEGVWLNNSFAEAWDIHTGDSFTAEYEGVQITKEVKGLIMTPEYLYTLADGDADTNLANLAYIYLAKDGFPFRELLTTNIKNGSITAADLAEGLAEDDELRETLKNVPAGLLTTMLDLISDEDLMKRIPSTTMLFTTNTDEDVMGYEEQIADALDHNYAAMIDEHMVMGVERFLAEMEQHEMFSYTFALIFVLVAVLIIATSMARLVERQRVQIGTMNAMGLKSGKIARHYVSYSLLLSLLGAVLGFFAGIYGFARFMIDLFSEYYVLPHADVAFGRIAFLVIFVTVGACALASYAACRKILRIPPAEALRPAAPKKAKRSLLEKLPFFTKLGFASRYNLRDLSRAKFRAVMGIFGTACGMICAVFAFGCIGLVGDVDDWVFDRIQNYTWQAGVSEDANLSWLDETAEEYHGELVMQDAIELSMVGKNVSSADKSTQTITVIEGKGLYRVTDPKTEVTELAPGEAAITARLAKSIGAKVGDTVYWHLYTENTWYESVIGVITRSPETAGITLLREDFEKTGCRFRPSLLVSDDDLSPVASDPNITGVSEKEELRRIFLEGYEVVNLLVYTMLVISLVLIIAVLYNAGNMSFHERLKEFATLKVMGLPDRKIRGILNLENLWLSVIGIFAGMPFALPLLTEMMNSNGENFDYYLHIDWIYYAISAAFVILVTFVVGYLFNKKIRRLDLVGTLKGAE